MPLQETLEFFPYSCWLDQLWSCKWEQAWAGRNLVLPWTSCLDCFMEKKLLWLGSSMPLEDHVLGSDGTFWGWSLVGGSRVNVGVSLRGILTASLCRCFSVPERRMSLSHRLLPTMMLCFSIGPKLTGPNEHRLKPRNKRIFHPYKLILATFVTTIECWHTNLILFKPLYFLHTNADQTLYSWFFPCTSGLLPDWVVP